MFASTTVRPVPGHKLAMMFCIRSATVIATAPRLVAIHAAVLAVTALGGKPGDALAMIIGVRCATVCTQATTTVTGSSAMCGIH
jgi:hypothetical protein